jgi:hypothetical protein
MIRRPFLPLHDYQRVYQIIYSVLEASEIAVTHRACIFFATVGARILREHYNFPATISAGCMALMVDEARANVVIYGRNEGGRFVTDNKAFHAWVECEGWMIDFMAPIMGGALQQDGIRQVVPRRMLQKPLSGQKVTLSEVQRVGEFFILHDQALAESLIDEQSVQFADLMNVCLTWYRRPPKPLKEIRLVDSHGSTKILVLRAPSIDGVW